MASAAQYSGLEWDVMKHLNMDASAFSRFFSNSYLTMYYLSSTVKTDSPNLQLGYTIYYAGSEYRIKIREMTFKRI